MNRFATSKVTDDFATLKRVINFSIDPEKMQESLRILTILMKRRIKQLELV